MNKCQFQNFKNGLLLSQFSCFSVDCGCFPRGLLPVFGLWRLALLPLGRPLIWKIYQTFFHCKQSQNLWTPCFKIWWTLGFPGNKEQLWSKKMSCWPQSHLLKLPHQKKEDSNIPFPGKVSQNTPPREQYPALPSHRLQPTSIAACFTSLNSPCAAYVRTKGIL